MQTIKAKENLIKDLQTDTHQSSLGNTASVNENNSMITVSQAEASRFLQGLSDSLLEIDSFKEYVSNTLTLKLKEIESFENTTIKTFDTLVDAVKELKDKIETAGSYENYLEERIKNENLSKELSTLELQLSKERAEISITLKEIFETVKKSVSNIEIKTDELKSADDLIKESIEKFNDNAKESFLSYVKKSEENLEDIGKHLMAISQSQVEGVKIKCETNIKEFTQRACENLEIVKKQSIDFLKQVSEENKKLISKVPHVTDSKFSKKDIIIYIISALTFAGLLLNIFL